MPTFVLMCLDKPDALPLRMATREAHLAYIGENKAMVKVAGPLLDDGGGMCGSLFLLEAGDKAAVVALNADDPYTKAGLFGSVEIRAFKQSVGQPV